MRRDDFHPMRRLHRNIYQVEVSRSLVRTISGDTGGKDWIEITSPRIDTLPDISQDQRDRLMFGQMQIDQAITDFMEAGKNIILADPSLEEMLARTDLGDLMPADLKVPYEAVYVAFSREAGLGHLDGSAPIDGVYLSLREKHVIATVTSRWQGADRRPWPFDEDPTARVVIEHDLAMTIDAAMEDWIEQEEGDLEGSDVVKYGGRALMEEWLARDRANRANKTDIKKAISLALNIAAYMGHAPEDAAKLKQVDDAPAALKAKAETAGRQGLKARQALIAQSFIPVTIIGREIGRKIAATTGAPGGAKSAHWRRGHWRRQKHGPNWSLVRLKWIFPTKVGAPNEENIPGRIYRIAE